MAANPRILLVDDQRDVTRMLRSALETISPSFDIVEAASGEDAESEIRRSRSVFDMLVTDLRLTGMNGMELIRRARIFNPHVYIVVVSAYSDQRTQSEVQKAGGVLFPKPLKVENFQAHIRQTFKLAAAPPPPPPPSTPARATPPSASRSATPARAPAPPPPPPPVEVDKPMSMADRLSTLRRDVAATAVFLVDSDGKIAVRAGDVMKMKIETALAPMMEVYSASLRVCQILDIYVPFTTNSFEGEDVNVYCINVGVYFALVIIFDVKRAGIQGAVMRYGRQCADDLLHMMEEMGVMQQEAEPAPVEALLPATLPPARPSPASASAPAAAPAAPRPKTSPLVMPKTAPLVMRPPEPPKEPPKPLTPEELKALDEALKKPAANADSFWDTVIEGSDVGNIRSDALSWEQAEKLGLLPK